MQIVVSFDLATKYECERPNIERVLRSFEFAQQKVTTLWVRKLAEGMDAAGAKEAVASGFAGTMASLGVPRFRYTLVVCGGPGETEGRGTMNDGPRLVVPDG